jgi:phosphatidylglycerol lysyltransferase
VDRDAAAAGVVEAEVVAAVAADPIGGSEASQTADQLRCLEQVRQWGDFTQAYSTAVQTGLERFWHRDAYLAYQVKWRVACVLGDPVGPDDQHEPLLREFLAAHRTTCFWQVSRVTARILAERGFWINEMGVDTRLDLADYAFTGRRKERLRAATNWLDRHAYTIREGSYGQDIDRDEIRSLSGAWQATRQTRRTVRFFNRPIVYRDEPDVRKFFLFDPQGRVAALVSFDPLYRRGEVIGYSPAIKRRLPTAPLRAEEGLMKRAIEQFQREGRERIMLGLSPLAGIRDEEFRANRLIHFSWSRGLDAWWVNRYFYNLRGHADFKRRFGGREEPTYYASDCLFNDFRVIATLRLAGAL